MVTRATKIGAASIAYRKWLPCISGALVLLNIPGANGKELQDVTAPGRWMGFFLFIYSAIQFLYLLYNKRHRIKKSLESLIDIELGTEDEVKSKLDKAFTKAKIFHSESKEYVSEGLSSDILFSARKGVVQHSNFLMGGMKHIFSGISDNCAKEWGIEISSIITKISIHCAFAIVCYLSRKHRGRLAGVCFAWVAYLGCTTSIELSDTEEFHEIMNSESAETLRSAEDTYATYKMFISSPLGQSITRLLERAIGAEVGVDIPGMKCLAALWKGKDMIDDITHVFLCTCRAVIAYKTGAGAQAIMDTFSGSSRDDEFIECRLISDDVQSGNFIRNGHNPQDVLLRFMKLQESLTHQRKAADPRYRNAIVAKEIAVGEWLRELRAKEIQGRPKMQPFTVTLYGVAGIGKSVAIEALSALLHNTYNTIITDKSERINCPRVGNFSIEDEYDSNLDSATTCILMNDIGVEKVEFRKNTVISALKRMSDSVVEPFVKADLASKGTCFNLAKFIIITTNAPDAGAGCEATDKDAAIRRLGITIHMECKESAKRDGKPDPRKMSSRPGMLPDHCEYTFYNLIESDSGQLVQCNDKSYTRIDAAHAMTLLREKLSEHVENYENRQQRTDALYCKYCGMPKAMNCMCFMRYDHLSHTEAFQSESNVFLSTVDKVRHQMFLQCVGMVNQWTDGAVLRYQYLFLSNAFYYETTACILVLTLMCVVCMSVDSRLTCVIPVCTLLTLIWALFLIYARVRYCLKKCIAWKDYDLDDFDIGASRVIGASWSWTGLFCNTSKLLLAYYALKTIANKFRVAAKTITKIYPQEMGYTTLDERKAVLAAAEASRQHLKENLDVVKKDVIWCQAFRTIPLSKSLKKGYTSEQFCEQVQKGMYALLCIKEDGNMLESHAFMLEEGVLLAPLHTVLDMQKSGREIIVSQTLPGKNTMARKLEKLEEQRLVKLPHIDLCLIACNGFGSRPKFTDFIGIKRMETEAQGTWLHYEDDMKTVESVPVYIRPDDFCATKATRPVRGYKYRASTRNGLCGSVLIVHSKSGSAIIGFHIAGDGKEGCSAPLIHHEITNAMLHLRTQCGVALHMTEKEGLADIPGYTKTVTDLHPRNPLNYVPYMEGAAIQHYGDVGVDFTPQSRVTINVHKDVAAKYFTLPDLVIRNPKAPLVWNELAQNAAAPMRNVDSNLMKDAIDDYLDMPTIDKFIEEDKKKGILVFGRPYTIDEVLNGIPGHPYKKSIKSTTSAGFPFNQAKNKILLGEPGTWALPEELEDVIADMTDKVFSGKHSGTVYKCTIKDEAGPPEKVDKPRLFQAGNMLSLIMQTMYLGPAIDFMTAHPDHFEIAIGVNPHDISWHNVIAAAFTKFEHGFEIDYSKYDQTQCPDIKAGVGKVLARLAVKILELNNDDLPKLEYLCSEFVLPLINFRGAIVELPNLMPSGTLTTAHGNCIYNSLITRLSVYEVWPGIKFRDHMAFRALGDDNGGSFSKELLDKGWDQLFFSQFVAKYGMGATNGGKQELSQKYIDPHDIVFLSRETVYHSKRGHCVGRLVDKSLFKALVVTQPTKEHWKNQQADVARSVWIEALNCDEVRARKIWDGLVKYLTDIKVAVPDTIFDPANVVYENKAMPTLGFTCTEYTSESNETVSEVLTIVDPPAEEVVAKVSTPDPIKPVSYGHLGDYLDREYMIFQQTYSPKDPTVAEFNPFLDTLTHDVLARKLDNITLMRTDIELRFVCSATNCHSGSFVISYLPMANLMDFQEEATFWPDLRNVVVTSRQNAILRVGNIDMEVTMTVPFLYWSPYISPVGKQVLKDMGSVSITPASPIIHSMGTSQKILIRAYAKLVNYSFSGATAFRSEGSYPDEKMSSTVSVLANMAGKAEMMFSAVNPNLAVPATVTRQVLEGISGVARLFGHSKPMLSTNGSVVNDLTGPLAATNLNIPAKTLALDADQGVTLSGLIGGSDGCDTLTHDYLLSKKVLVGVYKVTDAVSTGDVIFECGVTPAFALSSHGSLVLTPMGIVASQYNLWCGTMHYEIVVSSCSQFGAKFIVYHDAYTGVDRKPETNKSLIFDTRDTNRVALEVGWATSRMMLRTNSDYLYEPLVEKHTGGYTNGSISVHMHSPLIGTGIIAPEVHVELWAWADKDTVFADRTDYLNNYELVNDNTDDVPRVRNVGYEGSYNPPPDPSTRQPSARSALTGRDERISRIGAPATAAPTTLPPTTNVEPTEQPVMTAAPVGATKEPSTNAPSFWPSLFTAAPTKNASTSPPTKQPAGMPTSLPTVKTQNPAMVATLPPKTAAPTPIPVTAQCAAAETNVMSAWFLGSDGYIGRQSTFKVLRLEGATYIQMYYYARTDNVGSVLTTINFTGTLMVDGVNVGASPYRRTYQHSQLIEGMIMQLNVTGSTGYISSYKTSGAVHMQQTYLAPADILARVVKDPTDPNPPVIVSVQLKDGSVADAVKFTGNKSYFEDISPTDKSCLTSGRFNAVVLEGDLHSNYHNPLGVTSIDYPKTFVAAHNTTTYRIDGGNGITYLLYMLAMHDKIDGRKLYNSESYEGPVRMSVGVRPNTTEVLAICAGERMNSLRSLLQIATINNRISVGGGGTSLITMPLHGYASAGLTLPKYIQLCHVGVRGGVLTHYHLLSYSVAMLRAYRPPAADMPDSLASRGYEATDTRVNPALSVKYPYYSPAFFNLTRSSEQLEGSSLQERGVLVNAVSDDVTLYISTSIAEDYSLIQFIGSPLIKRASN
jgi:hypothetical protein